MVKNLPANVGDKRDSGSVPGLGRFPGVGNGNPLQYSCLENSMDRKAWWATVHEVAKSWTRPNNQHTYTIPYKSFSLHLKPRVLLLPIKSYTVWSPLLLYLPLIAHPLLQPNSPSCCSLNMLASFSLQSILADLSMTGSSTLRSLFKHHLLIQTEYLCPRPAPQTHVLKS